MSAGPVPDATVARLPLYLRALNDLTAHGSNTVSSERLARLAGFNAAMVRKDLSHLGSWGTRGVGYSVNHLEGLIRHELGLDRQRPVVIAGGGHLGQALCNYRGFRDRGFPILAVIDTDPDKIGTRIGDIPVHAPDDLPELVGDDPGVIGVLAVPGGVAQAVADGMVSAGIHALLSFAPAVVEVPVGISMRKVDFALELQILSFYAQRDETDAGAPVGLQLASDRPETGS
jgi:redox-sensing transcriptional repressor